MRSAIKICSALAALAVFCACFAGCKSTGDKHDKETTAIRLYLEASASDAGRSKTVLILREHPTAMQIQDSSFLDERFVENASVLDWNGSFLIQIKFDWHGAIMLGNVTTANPGKHIAIESSFGEQRWLAAPSIQRRMTDGVITFTPDATREEADRIVRGLNNLAKKLTTHKRFHRPPDFSDESAPK